VKIRHGPTRHDAKVNLLEDGHTLSVVLPVDDSVAPGQYCAIYEGEECLGAGPISEQRWQDLLPPQIAQEWATFRNSASVLGSGRSGSNRRGR